MAVPPSADTAPVSNGSLAEVTWASREISVTADSTAWRAAGVPAIAPSARNTTRAVPLSTEVPVRCSSRSSACWDSVPGMVNASDVVPESCCAPRATPPSRAIHTKITSQRRLNAKRPTW